MSVADGDLAGGLDALLGLNNAAVPAVNELEPAELLALAAMGRLRTAGPAADPAGFILTLPAGRPYDSLNYRWFDARYTAFTYVDRVVVGAAAQGRGLGRLLYEDAIAHARAERHRHVLAEVNVDPPNPGSLAFHAALGFATVAERENPEAGKTVAMQVLPLAE